MWIAIGAGWATIWWLGLAVVVLVVVPLVLLIARDILRAVKEIRQYSDDILQHGVGLAGELDPVPELQHTSDLTRSVSGDLERLASGLQRLVGGAR
jgi:hypothetical protein